MKSVQSIVIDGAKLEVRSWPGLGPPLLLLHEGLGSVATWRDFPDLLAQSTGLPVIAWSRKGYGQSDPLSAPRDPNYLHDEAALVPKIMTALSISTAHLLGHSDGASIAMIAAAQSPDRVLSLVLEAPHVYVEQLTIDGLTKIKALYQTTDLKGRLARYHADPDSVFRLWNGIWLDPRFKSWNIEKFLPQIRVPMLLIQGRDDEYGSIDQLDRIAGKVVQAERLVLTACGHSPHRDYPAQTVAAIAEFLARTARENRK